MFFSINMIIFSINMIIFSINIHLQRDDPEATEPVGGLRGDPRDVRVHRRAPPPRELRVVEVVPEEKQINKNS